MSRISTKPVRGTRDFFPEQMRARQWLFGVWREVAEAFGFEEIDAPVVEHAELFIRKAGEEIVDQLYHFEIHDRHLALRPELTPQVARMVMARAGSLRLPLRWWSIPQCWRYERTTRGRRREHYQWNMDVWGEPGVGAEAELVAAVFAALARMGLPADAVRMRVNSRSLVEEALRSGVLRDRPEAFEPLCVIIDKLAKVGTDAVVEMLCDAAGPVGLAEPAARDVVGLLGARDLADAARLAGEDSPALGELRRLFELLDAYGLADRVRFDASTVRGLAYYTGIVFEAFDTGGELRSICGGGRYDRLLASLGGPSIPAVGFGFGDAVVGELLAEHELWPGLRRSLDDVVHAFGDAERPAAVRLATRLRAEGHRVELTLGEPRLRKVLADADREGAARVWLVGPDELARGVARVREMATGEERDLPL